MRTLTLFLAIFLGMRFSHAQVPSMACPIPLPGPNRINESASSLGFSSYSLDVVQVRKDSGNSESYKLFITR